MCLIELKHMNTKTKKISFRYVPCDGCFLCCKGDAIRLTEEDNPDDYITEAHPYIPGALMLAHKQNGDCIYLVDSGCSIHDHEPLLCRNADCRSIALKYNFSTAMRLHQMKRIDIRVWDKGNELLKKLKEEKF